MKTVRFTAWACVALLSLGLSACSSNDEDKPPQDPLNPLEDALAAGALTLEGVDAAGLNRADTVLAFAIKDTTFAAAANEVRLSINAKPVDAGKINVASGRIRASVVLDEGRNDIVFKAYDVVGRPVYLHQTVWAGSNKLAVRVLSAGGALAPDGTTVTLRLSDKLDVVTSATTVAGVASFANVPSRTVVAEARTSDNGTGVAGAVGADGSMTVRLVGFNMPDATANNDFSQGLAGYQFGTSPVVLVPHIEKAGPQPGASPLASLMSFQRADRSAFDRLAQASGLHGSVAAQANAADLDAMLSTSGEGAQTLSRTFVVKPGTTSVSVRYRFVTCEVPGGYFGSKFNDYFSVTIRTKGGQSVTESNAMNGLGLAAFDASGSTAWKRFVLKTDKAGDEVQFDMTVANVADDLLDSQIIVDLIEEKTDQVTPQLAWDPEAGGLKLSWKVGPTALAEAVTVAVYWSSSTQYGGRIGAPITTVVVPAGTAAGATGSSNVQGSLLHDNLPAASHLLAAVDETLVGAVPDVAITYGPVADPSAVSAALVDAIKDGLRSAGAQTGSISRTAVTPADQARAMFQNLTKLPGPLSANIATQIAVYAAPGEAVIAVFSSQTTGMTPAQAIAQSAAIQSAMTDEINAQGPDKVSKHCADPATISVADVPQSNFTASGMTRFKTVAAARSRLLDENAVYHMEIVLAP